MCENSRVQTTENPKMTRVSTSIYEIVCRRNGISGTQDEVNFKFLSQQLKVEKMFNEDVNVQVLSWFFRDKYISTGFRHIQM